MGKIRQWPLAMFFGGLLAIAGHTQALAQNPTSRLVVPGGAATSSKIIPGGSVSFDVRVDSPTINTVGAAFRIKQTAPAGSGFLTITARDFTGSIYNDPASGTPDHCPAVTPTCPSIGAGVLDGTNPLLGPSSTGNLGRNTVGLVGAPTGTNLFVETITLISSGATPLGTYTIQPLSGSSFITDPTLTDYPMGGSFDIVIGQTLTVVKTGTGTGTVTANSGLINCGGVCSDIYPGTVVILTAAPAGGSTFTGWSGGGCSGTGTCTVTVNAATSVTANFDVPTFALTVSKTGTGAGTVTSNVGGINCGVTCTANYTSGTVVTLTAAPSAGSRFNGWSGGGCSGTGTCVTTVTAAVTVTANFVLTFDLTVSKTGTGTGTVTSSPGTINCPGTCVNTFDTGTVVALTPNPAAGSRFTGWSGDCTGTGACSVTMSQARAVTANFVPTFVLTVSKAGAGTGTVTSNVGGITCGVTCSATYDSGTVVTLTATPDATFTFVGWSGGGCTGTGTCVVTVSAATTVTATFATAFSVTVNKTGSGTGTVTSDIGGINCGATCSASYTSGTVVNLTATPTGGSTFTGWSGACTGSGACQVTVDAAKSVTANFAASFLLTVTKAGAGTGTVTSDVGAINCGATCSASYVDGTVVTLTAAPAAGSVFTGWTGDCSGTSTCVVTVSAARNVTATFTPQFTLTVAKAGNSTGSVTSNVGGISCGATCSATYTSGAVVILTAAASSGSAFTGWSGGGCTGTGTCTVTITAATTVTATFTDSTPPTTQILTTPTNPSAQAQVQFTFSSNEPGTFECSLDGSSFSTCTSPAAYTVGNGQHTFIVRARDTAGNVDPNPPSFTWLAAGIPVNTAIPTLSEWMLMLLAMILGGLGMQAHRRRNRA